MGRLRDIPGVGKNIEQDLLNIGIREISDLKGKKPEELYLQDCLYKGFQEDKCQLYVFRLAVYFAGLKKKTPAVPVLIALASNFIAIVFGCLLCRVL